MQASASLQHPIQHARRHAHRLRRGAALACLALAAYVALSGGVHDQAATTSSGAASLPSDQRAVVVRLSGTRLATLLHSGDYIDLYDGSDRYDTYNAGSADRGTGTALGSATAAPASSGSRLVASNARVLEVLGTAEAEAATDVLVSVSASLSGRLAAASGTPLVATFRRYS